MTVGDAIEVARRTLGGGERREADELYAAVVCGPVSAAFLDRDKPIPEPVKERLLLAAERRALGWPQQYAAGRANFRGHWLNVDQRVLIPRPETEQLVELVIAEALKRGRSAEAPLIADVCTGSGAIAIALALEASVSGVIATDLSADALNVALENATMLGAKERIGFRRGNLLDPLLDDRFDIIVSNPPYVATAEWETLDRSVRDYEPRLALDGGADGLDPYRVIIAGAKNYLNPGGLLALEIDERRAAETLALARDYSASIEKDLAGRPRYLLAFP